MQDIKQAFLALTADERTVFLTWAAQQQLPSQLPSLQQQVAVWRQQSGRPRNIKGGTGSHD